MGGGGERGEERQEKDCTNLTEFGAHVRAGVDPATSGHVTGSTNPVPDPGFRLRVHNLNERTMQLGQDLCMTISILNFK